MSRFSLQLIKQWFLLSVILLYTIDFLANFLCVYMCVCEEGWMNNDRQGKKDMGKKLLRLIGSDLQENII